MGETSTADMIPRDEVIEPEAVHRASPPEAANPGGRRRRGRGWVLAALALAALGLSLAE